MKLRWGGAIVDVVADPTLGDNERFLIYPYQNDPSRVLVVGGSMKVEVKNGRVILDLTEREWTDVMSAFSVVQHDAQADENNETMNSIADITYKVEAMVRAARSEKK